MMELTKQDKKQIEKDVKNIVNKIEIASSEYAHLYEMEFYRALIDHIAMKKEVSEYARNFFKTNEG